MAPLSVRQTFGHAAASLEQLRATEDIARPVSVSILADDYRRDVVFDEPIVTSEGVALGGRHTLTLRRDGTYRYQGHFRATGFPSFSVAILTTVGFTRSLPGSTGPAAVQVAVAANGRVVGSNPLESGDQVFYWDQSGRSALIADEWDGLRRGRFQRHLEHDPDWFGPLGDIVSFLAQIVGMAVLGGSAGVGIVLLGTAADIVDFEQAVLPSTVGILLAGGAAFVAGPGMMFPAFVGGVVATAELIDQRPLREEERVFARQVFGDTLPVDRVLLTNILGHGNRAFTTPAPGGTILVNMGDGFHDPINYTGNGAVDDGSLAKGQLLIHELTHAWQIANESFTPQFYCRALTTAIGTAGGNMAAYRYGPPTQSWSDFGTEQQASIVEEWFAGKHNRAGGPQTGYEPMRTDVGDGPPNPYFRYIRDNIKTGVAG